MTKAKIVERTKPDGSIIYVIKQKHLLFRWLWVDASCNSICPHIQDTFYTLEEAQQNLCWFDGTKTKERDIEENE